jgi:hypothetical protein
MSALRGDSEWSSCVVQRSRIARTWDRNNARRLTCCFDCVPTLWRRCYDSGRLHTTRQFQKSYVYASFKGLAQYWLEIQNAIERMTGFIPSKPEICNS